MRTVLYSAESRSISTVPSVFNNSQTTSVLSSFLTLPELGHEADPIEFHEVGPATKEARHPVHVQPATW